jgi:predicted lipoprotein
VVIFALTPFQLSNLSLPSMIASLEGVYHLYENGGMGEIATRADPAFRQLIDKNKRIAIEGMRALLPAGQDVFEKPEQMAKLAEGRDLLAFINTEVPLVVAEATGIDGMSLGFFAEDGD